MLPLTNIIELKNAGIYQADRPVLKGVNLALGKGEFAYLVGRTGTGKSSLLKTLYGELPLKEGQGSVAGTLLNGLTWKDKPMLRRKMGIVFQDFNLLEDRSVVENLMFVLKATGWNDMGMMKTKIQEVLKHVSLEGKEGRYPHELSGGEQQRVVIARALLNNPQVILADEPTGNLDPDTSDEIMLLLRKLCRSADTAILLATHDYMVIERFPARVIRCIDGAIEEENMFGF